MTRWGGACSKHREDEKCIHKFWFDGLKGRDCSQNLDVDGYNMKVDNKEIRWGWIGYIWLRIRNSGGPF
jgi:hypothetical protein